MGAAAIRGVRPTPRAASAAAVACVALMAELLAASASDAGMPSPAAAGLPYVGTGAAQASSAASSSDASTAAAARGVGDFFSAADPVVMGILAVCSGLTLVCYGALKQRHHRLVAMRARNLYDERESREAPPATSTRHVSFAVQELSSDSEPEFGTDSGRPSAADAVRGGFPAAAPACGAEAKRPVSILRGSLSARASRAGADDASGVQMCALSSAACAPGAAAPAVPADRVTPAASRAARGDGEDGAVAHAPAVPAMLPDAAASGDRNTDSSNGGRRSVSDGTENHPPDHAPTSNRHNKKSLTDWYRDEVRKPSNSSSWGGRTQVFHMSFSVANESDED